MRIIEFGEVPPPFGGVSVHVRRLLRRLEGEPCELVHVARSAGSGRKHGKYVHWPTLPRYLNHLEWIRACLPPFGKGVLHLHGNPVFLSPVVAVHLLRGGVAVVTVHDEMLGERLTGGLRLERRLFRYAASSRRVRWIAVSRNVRDTLVEHGVHESRIAVVPAYLIDEGADLLTPLPEMVADFLAKHDPRLVVYGYRRDTWAGRDLYGFDFAVAVLEELHSTCPRAGLVILCPDARQDGEAWEELRRRVRMIGLEADVLFLLEATDAPLTLWGACSVMLRPSATDGDSIAVREMLSLGRPVLASDVAPRPQGTTVLSMDSPEEWARAVALLTPLVEGDMVAEGLRGDGYAAIRETLWSSAGGALGSKERPADFGR